MYRWQNEESGVAAPARRWRGLVRLVVGQALVLGLILAAIAARAWLPAATPSAAPGVAGRPTALPATSISARSDAQVPEELATVGRRFLNALARGDLTEARRDLAPASLSTGGNRRLEGAAAALQSARARSFRILFWQPNEREPARLTLAFDYDRADVGEARSRVVLSVVRQDDRWYVSDLDLSPWMTDLGISRLPN
ncbi:MAG: hypothetical protein KatS3mg061_0890 [Dehalococcoidia bacterium]|nr:MAG: hypothetical protein KatS3mg061_0890 [Dehalococcoidia bacterium]